jgi:hypothetical protein
MSYIFTEEQHDLIKVWIGDAVKKAQQEVYREIADSLKSAGEVDHYAYHSMDELAAKGGCAMAAERISWMVES